MGAIYWGSKTMLIEAGCIDIEYEWGRMDYTFPIIIIINT